MWHGTCEQNVDSKLRKRELFIHELRANTRNAITVVGTLALVGTTSEGKKFDFSDNFVSKNSAQTDAELHELSLLRGKHS